MKQSTYRIVSISLALLVFLFACFFIAAGRMGLRGLLFPMALGLCGSIAASLVFRYSRIPCPCGRAYIKRYATLCKYCGEDFAKKPMAERPVANPLLSPQKQRILLIFYVSWARVLIIPAVPLALSGVTLQEIIGFYLAIILSFVLVRHIYCRCHHCGYLRKDAYDECIYCKRSILEEGPDMDVRALYLRPYIALKLGKYRRLHKAGWGLFMLLVGAVTWFLSHGGIMVALVCTLLLMNLALLLNVGHMLYAHCPHCDGILASLRSPCGHCGKDIWAAPRE